MIIIFYYYRVSTYIFSQIFQDDYRLIVSESGYDDGCSTKGSSMPGGVVKVVGNVSVNSVFPLSVKSSDFSGVFCEREFRSLIGTFLRVRGSF